MLTIFRRTLANSVATAAALGMVATPLAAQTIDTESDSAVSLPGPGVGNVRKATAVVNGEIITGSDIDERLALLLDSGETTEIPADQMELARQQVLSNLVDETLQIQEAEAKDIVITDADVDATYASIAQRSGASTVDAFSKEILAAGSSPHSMKRQIKADLAWQRLLGREVSPFVNVGDDEVNSVIERLTANKGTTEVRIGEIYLTATPENIESVSDTARKIIEALQQGGSFAAYARQFSQASTASRGGDLGWVRPEMLPSTFIEPINEIQVGQIVGPIAAPGGISVLYLMDRRQVLGVDPNEARLSLKQIFIDFTPDQSNATKKQTIDSFSTGISRINGCGDAENIASQLGAQVISRDDIRMGDLPAPLRTVMSTLSVGQATPPYGSPEEGVRAFVLCGRDAPEAAGLPSAEQIRDNLEQDRINKKARIYLRDLRQDAIIRYN